jgi:hypothetical protein
VPKRVDGDARGKIEIFPVLNIPQIGALALDKDGRWAGVGGHHEGGMLADEGGAGRVVRRVRVWQSGVPLDLGRRHGRGARCGHGGGLGVESGSCRAGSRSEAERCTEGHDTGDKG